MIAKFDATAPVTRAYAYAAYGDLELEAPARAAAGMRNCVLLTGFYLLGLLPAAPLALKGLLRPRCILVLQSS